MIERLGIATALPITVAPNCTAVAAFWESSSHSHEHECPLFHIEDSSSALAARPLWG